MGACIPIKKENKNFVPKRKLDKLEIQLLFLVCIFRILRIFIFARGVHFCKKLQIAIKTSFTWSVSSIDLFKTLGKRILHADHLVARLLHAC